MSKGIEQALEHSTPTGAKRYLSSPLEAAFNFEIKDRFHTKLLAPQVNPHQRLVRVSRPVAAGDRVVAFQYTRHDILTAYHHYLFNSRPEDWIQLLLEHNPSVREVTGRAIEPDEDAHDPSGSLLDVLDREYEIVDAIKNRVIQKNEALDPWKALTDPAYYTEGKPIKQWPESFEFAVFRREPSKLPKPATIERRGRLHGVRAEVYGIFGVAPGSKPIGTGELQSRDLIVYYPQLYYDTVKAFLQGMGQPNEDQIYKKEGLDVDDYNHGLEQPSFKMGLGMLQEPKSTREFMHGIGRFVAELCHVPREV